MAKIRSKKIKAVQKEYDWYKKKVVEMEMLGLGMVKALKSH